MKKTVTRFAPSPTGVMHLGNARTALFNYLYAKHTGGQFLLRIEDTDKERSTEQNTNLIYDILKKMGLSWDGDVVIQSHNLKRHTEVAEALINSGKAYRAYDTPEELNAMREDARKAKTSFRYKSVWQDVNHPPYPKDKPYVVRIRNTFDDNYPITIEDMVQGSVTRLAKEVDDFIILRSDGSPTYLLSVVVDDHDAGVNTIIRGDDHLTNTFRQYLIWNAMEWDMPDYAHVPLILGPDGKKLSKRHGAISIEDLDRMGFGLIGMPGVINYLATLGWTPKPDTINVSEFIDMDFENSIEYLNKLGWHVSREKEFIELDLQTLKNNLSIVTTYNHIAHEMVAKYMENIGVKYKIPEILSISELIEKFNIHDVNRSPAQFNMKKLLHINGAWMNKIGIDEFTIGFLDYLSKEQPEFMDYLDSYADDQIWFELKELIPSLPIRSKTFAEAFEMIKYMSPDIYKENIKDHNLENDKAICSGVIKFIDKDNIDILDAMKKYAESNDLKLKSVANSVRLVFTGQKVSPPLQDIITSVSYSDFLKKIKPNKQLSNDMV